MEKAYQNLVGKDPKESNINTNRTITYLNTQPNFIHKKKLNYH